VKQVTLAKSCRLLSSLEQPCLDQRLLGNAILICIHLVALRNLAAKFRKFFCVVCASIFISVLYIYLSKMTLIFFSSSRKRVEVFNVELNRPFFIAEKHHFPFTHNINHLFE